MCVHLSVQPRTCGAPVTIDRGRRHTKNIGGLCDRVAAEETALDHLRHPLILLCKTVEEIINKYDILRPKVVPQCCLLQIDARTAAAPFVGCPTPGDIHQNLPHGARRHGIKMLAILPLDRMMIDELLVRLVHQFGGLKRVIVSLAVKLIMRDPSELIVHSLHEIIQSIHVATTK